MIRKDSETSITLTQGGKVMPQFLNHYHVGPVVAGKLVTAVCATSWHARRFYQQAFDVEPETVAQQWRYGR